MELHLKQEPVFEGAVEVVGKVGGGDEDGLSAILKKSESLNSLMP